MPSEQQLGHGAIETPAPAEVPLPEIVADLTEQTLPVETTLLAIQRPPRIEQTHSHTEFAPLWGLAGNLALLLVVAVVTLISAPRHELAGLAEPSTWNTLGVSNLRRHIHKWSNGAWPLNEPVTRANPSHRSSAKPEWIAELDSPAISPPSANPASAILPGTRPGNLDRR